jgi:predicted Holliday junction resolvase-like endonuclease
MNQLFSEFQEFRKILCICPCCGDLVRVSDLKIKVKGPAYKTWLDEYEKKDLIISNKEERFEEKEEGIRKISVEKGRRDAEKACYKLTCSGLKCLKLNPFDIKPILSPIDFVAFNGMYKGDDIKDIIFLNRESGKSECCKDFNMLKQQVKKAVIEKKYDWQVARIDESGKIEIEE